MGRPKKIEKEITIKNLNLSKFKPVTPNLSKGNGSVVYINKSNTLAGGSDNSYLEYLLDLSDNTSPTHSNILALKKNMIYGKGFISEDPATEQYLKAVNPNQDGNDLLNLISEDFSVFEAAAIEVVWSKDGSQPINLYQVDIHKLRPEIADEFGHVPGYWKKNNWLSNNRMYGQTVLKNLQQPNEKEVFIPVFNPDRAKEFYTENDEETKKNPELIGSLKEPVQILYIKKPNAGQPYFAIPNYASASNYIEVEKQLGVFHNASVTNGFFPSLIINPVGNPTPEVAQKYLNNIVNSFSGAENAAKAFVEFIQKAGDETKVTPIQLSNNADIYDIVSRKALEMISSAHGISSPELAGAVTSNASLGGDSNKLSMVYQLFYANVIKPYQNIILKGFNKILKAKGLQPVEIMNEQPLFLISPDLIKTYLTEDEIRESIFGKKPKLSSPNAQVDENGNEIAPPATNDFLSKLSGTQWRQLNRIIRDFGKERISETQAKMMIQKGFGFNDEEINSLLNGE